MDMFDPVGCCLNPDDHQEQQKMKKLAQALLPFLGALLACLSGCAHQGASSPVKSAAANISQIQDNLSAVDAKNVVIENWLKTHK